MPSKASGKGEKKEKEMTTNDSLVIKEKITIGFCVAIASILVIMEGYVIIHLPDQFLLIGFLVIPLAIDIYVMVNSVINLSLINKKEEREKFDELYRAEKASYIIIRKSFEELQDRLNDLEASNGLPADDIINVQKAVAKVSINRNKENAMALMDSNNKLIEQIEKLEEKFLEANQNIRIEQEKLIGATREDLLKRNQDLERQLNRLEDVLRNSSMHQPTPMPQFYQPVMMPGMMPQATMPQSPMPQTMQQPIQQNRPVQQVKAEYSSGIESDDLATLAFQDEKSNNYDSDLDIPNFSLDLAEENSEELEAGLEIEPDITPDIDIEPEEEPEADLEIEPDITPDIDIELEEEPEADLEIEPDITPDIDIEPEERPDTELKIDIPQLSDDPNHKMTADEIAKMFAAVDNTSAAIANPLETVAVEEDSTAYENEEDKASEHVGEVAEKVPVTKNTGSSDFNKIMTPEEIEKLFTNL